MQSTQTYPTKLICEFFGMSISELNDSLDEMDVKEVLASRFSADDFFIMLV